MKHTCPFHASNPKQDSWQIDGVVRKCSWCGSIHPENMLQLATELTVKVADGNKLYLGDLPFELAHLNKQQMNRFIELFSTEQLKMDLIDYFYILSFFTGDHAPKK